MEYVDSLAAELRQQHYGGRGRVVEIDAREIGGARGWEWIKKGIPLRAEIGPRDISEDAVFMARRDKPHREKSSIKRKELVATIADILDEIQATLFNRAREYRDAHTVSIEDPTQFKDFFTPENEKQPEIHGGFARAHWCGSEACENEIKDSLGVTIRCIPFDSPAESGSCIGCGDSSEKRVIFAKAY